MTLSPAEVRAELDAIEAELLKLQDVEDEEVFDAILASLHDRVTVAGAIIAARGHVATD